MPGELNEFQETVLRRWFTCECGAHPPTQDQLREHQSANGCKKAARIPSDADECENCGHIRRAHGGGGGKPSDTWCCSPASGERAKPWTSLCNCLAFVSRPPASADALPKSATNDGGESYGPNDGGPR